MTLQYTVFTCRCSETSRHHHHTLSRGSDNGFETLQVQWPFLLELQTNLCEDFVITLLRHYATGANCADVLISHLLTMFRLGARLAQCLTSVLNVKALVGAFNRGGPSRGFLHNCEIFANLRRLKLQLLSRICCKCVVSVLNFISPLQRKEFNQDRFGSSCQYQTSVFQDNRVSPDVIPDSFTHLNKCQDFTASINDSKQVNTKT